MRKQHYGLPDDKGSPVTASESYLCPNCSKAMRRIKGSKSYFWGCSGYRDGCKTSLEDKTRQTRCQDCMRKTAMDGDNVIRLPFGSPLAEALRRVLRVEKRIRSLTSSNSDAADLRALSAEVESSDNVHRHHFAEAAN